MNEFIILLWKLSGTTVIVGLGLFFLNGPDSVLGQQFLKAALVGLFGIAALQIGGIVHDLWQSIVPDLSRLFRRKKSFPAPDFTSEQAPQIMDANYYPTPRKASKHTRNDDLIP